MDEPLSNLDAKLRVQMRAEISRLQNELGVTTIYVTHDQVEAMTMGDRVAVMRKGELQQVGSPQELYDRPVNLFVGGFIGSPSMNMVEATLERRRRAGRRRPSATSASTLEAETIDGARPALAGVRGPEGRARDPARSTSRTRRSARTRRPTGACAGTSSCARRSARR